MGYLTKEREAAIYIIALFEDLLNKNNISIPDVDRTGEDGEARLFGNTYYQLEDSVTKEIEKYGNKLVAAIAEKRAQR